MSEEINAGRADAGDRPDGPVEALPSAPWLLREVIEQAPVGVALFDRDIRFVQVNGRLAEINGRPASAHLGRRPDELLSGLPPEAYLPAAQQALAGTVTEAVELSGETPAKPGVTRHWLESWAPVRSPGGQVVGVLAFVVEITDRRRAEQALRQRQRSDRARAQALADLAGVMAAASSVEGLAVGFAERAAAAAGAAFSNLALLTADGRSLRLHHQESLDEGVARRWSEVSLEDPVPLVDAVRRREPVFIHSPEDNAERYPLLAADTDRAGLAATASLPLLNRHGAVLGAVGFAWSEPQSFPAEVRAALDTVAQLTSQSLERARLHEAEHAARERASVLAEATTAIGMPGSAGERLQRVCESLVPSLADLALAELSAEAGGPKPVAILHRDPRGVDALRILLKPDTADAQAVQGAGRILATGQAELLSDTCRPLTTQDAPDPRWLEMLEGLGINSYLGVPLRAGPAVIGALLLGHADSGRRFGTDDLAFAVDLGERIGLALDNVRLTEAEHEIAAELQRQLLPARLTAPAGTVLSARYRAGHARLDVGGDWYEVVARPDGQAVIAIGDVVGHGPRAAAAMGQIRSALTATASAAGGPGQLLGRLDEFAGRTPDAQYSTVSVAFLDPRDGDLRYACAGHLPPALLGPDGSAGLLEHGRSYPLWAAGPKGDGIEPRHEGRATVPAGGRLVLYTDGLIERRDASLDDGFARLLKAMQDHRGRAIESFCDALLDQLLPEASGDDDAALLCIERTGAGRNPWGGQGEGLG